MPIERGDYKKQLDELREHLKEAKIIIWHFITTRQYRDFGSIDASVKIHRHLDSAQGLTEKFLTQLPLPSITAGSETK